MSMRIVCDVPGCASSEKAAGVIGFGFERQPLPPGWSEVRRAVKPSPEEDAAARKKLGMPPVGTDYPMPDVMHEQRYTVCGKHEIPAGPPLNEDDLLLAGHGFAQVIPAHRRGFVPARDPLDQVAGTIVAG